MSTLPFPLPRHQAAKRTGLVSIPVVAQGSAEDRKISTTAKLPFRHTASAGHCPSCLQLEDPSPPVPGRTPEPPALGSSHYQGRGLRRHRGDDDYSADKAASCALHNFLITTDHATTSHCGPRFPERCPSFFLHLLSGCLPLDPTLSSTHSRSPSQLGVRSPPSPSLHLLTLPFQTVSGPLGPIPIGVPWHHIPLRLCPPLWLTRRTALHPFSSLILWYLPSTKKKSS